MAADEDDFDSVALREMGWMRRRWRERGKCTQPAIVPLVVD